MYRHLSRLLLVASLLFFTVSDFSCINQFGIQGPSLNRKKEIRKIAPTFAFNSALFKYRESKGFWPKSEYDFSSYASEEIRQLYDRGFESWFFGNFSDNTLDVHFLHRPIEDGAHVGAVPIPYGKIRIKTTYTFPDRYVKTTRIKKKNRQQL